MKKTLVSAGPAGAGNSSAGEMAPANSLREQLIKIFKLPTGASDEDISWAAATAQQYNDNVKKQLADQFAEEEVISQKVKVGLSRDQAVGVIKRQRQHDAAITKQWEKRRPQIIKILKEDLKERDMRARVRELDASITIDEIEAARKFLETTVSPAGASPQSEECQ
jgi:hypothetical protein